MSKSFSSMQFEDPFRPGYGLSNWEVPRRHKAMPDKRVGKTQVVATDRGHLVPGAARRSLENPWGNFQGTWDMPTKVKGVRSDVTTARSLYGVEKLQLPSRPTKKTQELKEMQRMNEVVKQGGAARVVKNNRLDHVTDKTPTPIPPEERGAVPVDPLPEMPKSFSGAGTPTGVTPRAPLDLAPQSFPVHEEEIPSLPHGPGFLPPPPAFDSYIPPEQTPSPPPAAPQPQDDAAGNEVPLEEPTNPPHF